MEWIFALLFDKVTNAFLSKAGIITAEAVLPKSPIKFKRKIKKDFQSEYFNIFLPIIDNEKIIPLDRKAFNGLYGTKNQCIQLLKYSHSYINKYMLNQKQFNVNYQFIILTGPKGTGKTDHAQRLGKALGLKK